MTTLFGDLSSELSALFFLFSTTSSLSGKKSFIFVCSKLVDSAIIRKEQSQKLYIIAQQQEYEKGEENEPSVSKKRWEVLYCGRGWEYE
jgi:hypothetical protein